MEFSRQLISIYLPMQSLTTKNLRFLWLQKSDLLHKIAKESTLSNLWDGFQLT